MVQGRMNVLYLGSYMGKIFEPDFFLFPWNS